MEKKSSVHISGLSNNISVIKVMVIACIGLFAGRCFQHLFQDIPIRILLWDEYLMRDFLSGLGVSWQDYTQTVVWDQRIQNIVRSFGVLYGCCMVYCIVLWWRTERKFQFILLIGAASLLFLSILYFLDKFNRLGEWMEYSCQWTAPVILFLLVRKEFSLTAIGWLMRVAVALTFTGHAFYAIGFYPVPGNFIDMIIMSLGVSQSTATSILFTAGVLDIIVSVLVLVPYTYRYAALYAFAWGTLTALARIWANFDPSLTSASLIQWTPEVLMRAPNALMPLAIYLLQPQTKPISEVG